MKIKVKVNASQNQKKEEKQNKIEQYIIIFYWKTFIILLNTISRFFPDREALQTIN